MKFRIVSVSLILLAALAGCSSSTPSTATPSAADTAASSSASATTSPSTPSPSKMPSSSPVPGGTATDFCGAFKELEAVSKTPSGNMASVGAQFRAAAADMRKYAPADIKKAANTYADVIDNVGKAVASGSVDQASMSKAISQGMAGNAKDIGTVAMWVAKNCNM